MEYFLFFSSIHKSRSNRYIELKIKWKIKYAEDLIIFFFFEYFHRKECLYFVFLINKSLQLNFLLVHFYPIAIIILLSTTIMLLNTVPLGICGMLKRRRIKNKTREWMNLFIIMARRKSANQRILICNQFVNIPKKNYIVRRMSVMMVAEITNIILHRSIIIPMKKYAVSLNDTTTIIYNHIIYTY